MSDLKEDLRSAGERSKTPPARKRNPRSQVLQVHQQAQPERKSNQEDANIGKRLKGCLPTDPNRFCLYSWQ